MPEPDPITISESEGWGLTSCITLDEGGPALREIIRTWPKSPTDKNAKQLRRISLDGWTRAFRKQWQSQYTASPCFPYYPDDLQPITAEIERLSEHESLTLFESSLLVGLHHHTGPALFAGIGSAIIESICKGEIDPRRPCDMTPFSQLGDDLTTPGPDWLLTRQDVERYAVSRWGISDITQPLDKWPYRHDTRLLKAVRWVIATYWEMKNPETAATKELVVEKLMENLGLTKNEAEAVDLITRHDSRRNRKVL